MTDEKKFDFNGSYADILKIADKLFDDLCSDPSNTVKIDGPIGKVQFFEHLRDYHEWDGKEWLTWSLQGGGEMVSEMHDAEHDSDRQNEERYEGEEYRPSMSHTHPRDMWEA